MSSEDITKLLVDWNQGNEAARDELIPLVANELRRIASRYLYGERHEHTLQATALINEAYIRLVDQKQVQWQNRAHFFGVAAQLMRRILVDYARTRNAAKRDGQRHKLSLDDVINLSEEHDKNLVALDEALERLAKLQPQRSQIVELRFFGGMTIEETASVLNVSVDTVKAEWRLAKAWLYREISNLPEGSE
ncbi:MAG: sigma-70 family RNA polymerase sigma factor [Blastocatellia bacterium]|nr:sigma-70 family RNA polymerase sigma factor [Blastocatellia bacterium]